MKSRMKRATKQRTNPISNPSSRRHLRKTQPLPLPMSPFHNPQTNPIRSPRLLTRQGAITPCCILKPRAEGRGNLRFVMSFTIKSLALLAMAFSPCAFSQAGLLGRKSPDGKISFQSVEEFQIEGSHRVRLMPIATERITPDDAKHFARLELAQAGVI